jgi:acetolactate synthase small subunit
MERWLFLIRADNRPGVLAAITALFADRGVSLDGLTIYDMHTTERGDGLATLTFQAREAKKEHLARQLRRLEMVHELVEYRCDEGGACRAALARFALTPPELTAALPPEIRCDVIVEQDDGITVLLLGPPALLDETLIRLSTQGLLRTMMLVAL